MNSEDLSSADMNGESGDSHGVSGGSVGDGGVDGYEDGADGENSEIQDFHKHQIGVRCLMARKGEETCNSDFLCEDKPVDPLPVTKVFWNV